MLRQGRGYLLVASAASLWGLWSLFFRPAERFGPMHPTVQSSIVLGVIFVTVAPLAWRDRPPRVRPWNAWASMAALGVTDGLNVHLFFSAMQETTLAIAVLTHYLAPVLIGLAAPVVLRERMRASIWVALGAALAGLVLLLEPWREGGSWRGAALGSGSAVFFAANILVTKRIEPWFSPREILAWHMPTALLTLVCFVPAGAFAVGVAPLALVAAGGLVCGAFAGVVFLTGLARVDASRAAVLMLLEPFVAVVVGAVVWQEIPGPTGFVGAVLVLYGAYLMLRSEGASEHALEV